MSICAPVNMLSLRIFGYILVRPRLAHTQFRVRELAHKNLNCRAISTPLCLFFRFGLPALSSISIASEPSILIQTTPWLLFVWHSQAQDELVSWRAEDFSVAGHLPRRQTRITTDGASQFPGRDVCWCVSKLNAVSHPWDVDPTVKLQRS